MKLVHGQPPKSALLTRRFAVGLSLIIVLACLTVILTGLRLRRVDRQVALREVELSHKGAALDGLNHAIATNESAFEVSAEQLTEQSLEVLRKQRELEELVAKTAALETSVMELAAEFASSERGSDYVDQCRILGLQGQIVDEGCAGLLVAGILPAPEARDVGEELVAVDKLLGETLRTKPKHRPAMLDQAEALLRATAQLGTAQTHINQARIEGRRARVLELRGQPQAALVLAAGAFVGDTSLNKPRWYDMIVRLAHAVYGRYDPRAMAVICDETYVGPERSAQRKSICALELSNASTTLRRSDREAARRHACDSAAMLTRITPKAEQTYKIRKLDSRRAKAQRVCDALADAPATPSPTSPVRPTPTGGNESPRP